MCGVRDRSSSETAEGRAGLRVYMELRGSRRLLDVSVRTLLLVVMTLQACSIFAADLRVFCPNALREPMLELARGYVRNSGDKVEFTFASVGSVHKRIAAGERADIVIGTAEGIEALIKLGPGLAGSQVDIAKAALALAKKTSNGGLHVSTQQGLRQALAAARAIAAPDPRAGSPGGVQVEELLQRLELSAVLEPKMRWQTDAREAVKRLMADDVDLAVALMSDLLNAAKIDVVGPITAVPTRGIIYSALISRSTAHPDRARAFVAHLRGADAEQVLRRFGYLSEP